MLRGLIDIDRHVTAWVVAQFAAPVVQWVLLPFTAIGYAASVWLTLAALGSVLAPYLVTRRSSTRTGSEAAPVVDAHALGTQRREVARIRAALWRGVLALLLVLLVVDHVAKPLVGRERPFVHGPSPSPIVWVPTTTSFPSGHAASAAAGALALSRVWSAATFPFWILGGLIMLSRIALGVHYAGDVLGGALVGLLVASLVTVPVRRDAPR